MGAPAEDTWRCGPQCAFHVSHVMMNPKQWESAKGLMGSGTFFGAGRGVVLFRENGKRVEGRRCNSEPAAGADTDSQLSA